MNTNEMNASHQGLRELTMDEIDAVSGAGDTADAVAYAVGSAVGAAGALLLKFGSAIKSVLK